MSETTDNNVISNDIPPKVDVINNQYTNGKEVNASNGMFMLFISLALLVFAIALGFGFIGGYELINYRGYGSNAVEYPYRWYAIIPALTTLFIWTALGTIKPNESYVFSFFGEPRGVLNRRGFFFTNPFMSAKKVSLKIQNNVIDESKFNDANGTPVISGATVRWRIFDPELVVYDLEDDIENFLVAQIEGNLRSVVSKYPYESSNDDQQDSDVDAKSRGISLSRSPEEVGAEIANNINDDVVKYGIFIDQVTLTSLSYAPEVAAAMTQRQQAQSVMNAKRELSQGIVGVVKDTIANLENSSNEDKSDAIVLDKEAKQQLAKDLTLVLFGNSSVDPVIKVN